jgi:hypothetical protein
MFTSLRSQIGRLREDQSGATYSLQMILVLPFYVLVVVSFVEVTLTLNTKIGVTLAAQAAARSAAVWWPAQDLTPDGDARREDARRMGRVHLAAVNALAPFASGSQAHGGRISNAFVYPDASPYAWARAYRTAFASTRNGYTETHDEEFLARKWRYAAGASVVAVVPIEPDREFDLANVLTEQQDEQTFNSVLKVTVLYEMPYHTNGAGRILGTLRGGIYTKQVVSTVYIEKEGPKTEDSRLGFKDYYEVDPAKNEVFESRNAADGKPAI